MANWLNRLADIAFRRNRPRDRRRSLSIVHAAVIERLELRIVPTTVTAYEQYFLELINRARHDPVAEATRLGTTLNEGLPAGTLAAGARQPLALNDALQASIEGHLADELAHNLFSHSGSNGSTPDQRINAAGYSGWFTIGENLAIETTSGAINLAQFVTNEYQGLFTDTTEPGRGHRVNMLDGDFQEVGSAVQTGTYQGANAVDTGNDFGVRPGHSFVTGVVYTDSVSANNFYDIGEGIGGASITVSNSSATYHAVANAAGGYQLDIPSGTYTITFSGTGISSPIVKTFTISGLNVEVDANTRTDIPLSGPPALAGTHPINFTENAAAQSVDSTLVVTDPGRPTLSTATVSITNVVAGQDVIGFVPNSSTMGNIAVTSNSNGVLKLTSAGATPTLSQWQAALRAVTYVNTSNNPSTATRNVTFAVDDGAATRHLSNSLATTIAVTAVNDPPSSVGIETTPLAYAARSPSIAVSSTIALTDVDDTRLSGATIRITAGYQNGADLLTFVNTATISGAFNSTTGTLTLSGSDTIANYQAALRAVKFSNSSTAPTLGNRTVSFIVDDGHSTNNLSIARTRNVNVVAAVLPVVSAVPATALTYTENDPATMIAPGLSITDAGATNISSATIQITGNYVTGQDRLAFSNSAGVTTSFDATTGILSLTGTQSLAAYQTMLRSVTYANISNKPSTATRTILFNVIDSSSNQSVAVTRGITVAAVNDAPVLSSIETAPVTETTAAATAISATLLLTDPDDVSLSGATIRITGTYQNGSDILAFVNTAKIAGSFNASTGTLTLSGVDSVSNYRAALRSVTYANNNPAPTLGPRSIVIQANDGHTTNNLSNVGIRIFNIVNGAAPVLSNVASTNLAYTEKNPATFIAPTITISDSDSTTLTKAVIQITGNYATGQDRLTFTNSSSVTANFDATTGTLTLTGAKSLAAYQTMLQSVTYQNISSNPSTAVRTITFSVVDDMGNVNIPATRNIAITAVNDPPALSGVETAALSYSAAGSSAAVTSTLLLTEPDDTMLASATVRISSGYLHGEDLLTFVNTARITGSFNAATGILTLTGSDSVSNYRAALRSVLYSNSNSIPTAGSRTISFQANDGHAAANLSNIVTRTISVV